MTVDVPQCIVHRLRRQALGGHGEERTHRGGALRVGQLGPAHHEVRAEHIDVLWVHLCGQPPDETADTCRVVAAHIIARAVQPYDDTLMRIGKGGHRNRLVRAGAEAHAELFVRGLLEHGCGAKA